MNHGCQDQHGFLLSVPSAKSVVEKSSQSASNLGYCSAEYAENTGLPAVFYLLGIGVRFEALRFF